MTFQNYTCWRTDRVDSVLNTDAENVSNEVFLAVHSEHPLTLVDPNVENRNRNEANRWRLSAHEFLKQFLDPNRHHVQAVVQGESGSGKSHFIKWMALSIPPSAERYVLTIPRAGMSLRSIVELIIGVLPADKQQRYQVKLDEIGYNAGTREQQRESLINRIAEAISSDPRRSNAADEEEWLLEQLPNIFYDPNLRTVLDRQGGIIDELVDHIFEGPRGYFRLEKQRMFQQDDLPLAVRDIKQMSEKARDVLRYLSNDAHMISLSLEIINRNLNRAIPRVLNFTGEQLVDLVLDMRRYLRADRRNLVLLIEDFAALQGIDDALLQVLTHAASESNALCEMRWAMAVTSGYYERIPNSVQTRMHFLIDMDLPTSGKDAALHDDDIVSFAARYLNAVRLTEDRLLRWLDTRRPSNSSPEVPNACMACGFRAACHAAFGEENDVGLYPFTRDAILNMARRKDTRLGERFNPRILVKDVMAEVLGKNTEDLEAGEFPSAQLLDVMGGSLLPLLIDDKLKQVVGEHQHPRQHTLLELWGTKSGQVQSLPEGIFRAFSLEPVPLDKLNVEAKKDDEQPLERKQAPTRLDRDLQAVQAWGNGGIMPDQTAQRLRELIYESLETYIDWDGVGLERSSFARGTSGLFQRRYIIFERQLTASQVASIGASLSIPMLQGDRDEQRESAIALEGLLKYQEYRHWRFSGGAEAIAALAECLDRWSAHLLNLFHEMFEAEGQRDPVPAAVEVLAVGAALAGRMSEAGATLADQVNALFEPWAPDAAAAQAPEWRDLYGAIREAQDALREVVQTWACGTKGGQAGALIDPSKFVPVLEYLRRGWVPALVPSKSWAGRLDGCKSLVQVHARVRRDLATAARAEWKRRMEWLKRSRQYMPESISWNEVVRVLQGLRKAVAESGIGVSQAVMRDFTEELAAAEGMHLQALARELTSLQDAKDPTDVLHQLGRPHSGAAVAQADRFFTVSEQFFVEVQGAIGNREAALGHKAVTLQQDQVRIGENLLALADTLAIIGGSDAN